MSGNPFGASTLCRSLNDSPEIEKIADTILSALFLQHKNLFCFPTVQLKTVALQCPGSGLAKPAPCCRWGTCPAANAHHAVGSRPASMRELESARVHCHLLETPKCPTKRPLPVRGHTIGRFCVLLLLCFPPFLRFHLLMAVSY